MLRPMDIEQLKGNKSRYAVVIGVAKRARAITDMLEGDYKIMMPEKAGIEADTRSAVAAEEE